MRCIILIMNKQGKRGFTLLELVIALAIIGITGVVSAHFLWPVIDTYHRFSGRTDGRYLCESLFQVLEAELRYGKDFQVSGDGKLSYLVVEADGSTTGYECPALYETAEAPFIPEDCRIRITYRVSRDKTQVTMAMSVQKRNEKTGTFTEVYDQSAVVRSFYTSKTDAAVHVK